MFGMSYKGAMPRPPSVRPTQGRLDPGPLPETRVSPTSWILRHPCLQAAYLLGGRHPEASESLTGGYLEKAFQGLPCMSLVMSSSEKPASRMAGTNSPGTES